MKRQVILFFQVPQTDEPCNIIPLTPHTLFLNNILTKSVLKFLQEEIKEAWKSKHIFKKSKNVKEFGDFLQTLRDLLPVDIYFALKTNGTIWIVESSDNEKIIESLTLVE